MVTGRMRSTVPLLSCRTMRSSVQTGPLFRSEPFGAKTVTRGAQSANRPAVDSTSTGSSKTASFGSTEEGVLLAGEEEVPPSGEEDVLLSGDEEVLLSGDEDVLLAGEEDVLLAGEEDVLLSGDEDTGGPEESDDTPEEGAGCPFTVIWMQLDMPLASRINTRSPVSRRLDDRTLPSALYTVIE